MRQHSQPAAPLLWHFYLFFFLLGLLGALWPLPALFAATLLAVFEPRLRAPARLGASLCVFCAAWGMAGLQLWRGHEITANPPPWSRAREPRLEGRVISVQGMPGQRLRVILADVRPRGNSAAPLDGYCAWTWDEPAFHPLPGQTVSISRAVRPCGGFANESANLWEAALFAKKQYWRIWSRGWEGNPRWRGHADFLAAQRRKIIEKFMAALTPSGQAPSQAQAILPALLFGNRYYLDLPTVENFAAAAIAHSLALSGQHLGIAALFAWAGVFVAALAWPRIYLLWPRPVLILLFSLPLAPLYLWLGNAPPSLLRAGAMLLICAIRLGRGARMSGLDILLAALALILLFQPLAIFELGLQLSALCVAAIIFSWPLINSVLAALRIQNATGRALAIIFFTSFAIQLALLPITLVTFQQAGIWFPLNVLWLPALGLFVLPCAALGLLCSLLPFAAFAPHLLNVAALPCQWLLDLLAALRAGEWLAEPMFMLPRWPAFLAFACLAAAITSLLRHTGARATRLLFCVALAFFCLDPLERVMAVLGDDLRITAVDVGQGQAILVDLPDGARLVVDAGGSFSRRFDPGNAIVAPMLAANRAPTLAAAINSHPDQDHIGGMFYLLDKFRIGAVFHNGRAANIGNWPAIQAQANAIALCAGDVIEIGLPQNEIFMEVLHPPAGAEKLSGNAASLILRLVWRGRGIALFCGDAERGNLRRLVKSGADLSADVLFLPHHGSDKNLFAPFYAAVRPSLAIACCGFGNRYNYPGKKTRQALKKLEIPLLDTGNNGKIEVRMAKNGHMRADWIRKQVAGRP